MKEEGEHERGRGAPFQICYITQKRWRMKREWEHKRGWVAKFPICYN
jgi:hypothetical protein